MPAKRYLVTLTKEERQSLEQLTKTGKAEAHLMAIACSQAPAGASRWTLRMLADQMVV